MHLMTKSQLHTYIKKLERLYIVDNYQLLKLFSKYLRVPRIDVW